MAREYYEDIDLDLAADVDINRPAGRSEHSVNLRFVVSLRVAAEFGLEHAVTATVRDRAQSQGDCVREPRIASNELRKVCRPQFLEPHRGCGRCRLLDTSAFA